MRTYLKASIVACALLVSGVLVSPSAQVQIQRASTWFWSSASAVKISANGNDFTVTLADWGTTLSCEAVSIANDGVLFLGTTPRGALTSLNIEDDSFATYALTGDANVTVEQNDFNNQYTVTKDNANTYNIYYDAAGASGAGYYLQNKRGATRTVRNCLIGV